MYNAIVVHIEVCWMWGDSATNIVIMIELRWLLVDVVAIE